MKKLLFAADHAGWELKNELIAKYSAQGYECVDLGTNSSESVHYPEYADLLCEKLLGGGYDAGILVCGTGIGMSIAANRHKGIRAALCTDTFSALMSREHNNANVLGLSSWRLTVDEAVKIAELWLFGKFAGGRHEQRIQALRDIEEGKEVNKTLV